MLLVDGDPRVQEIIRRVLITEGVRIVESSQGAEAIEVCNRQPKGVDLLLTDIDMPGMSGLAFEFGAFEMPTSAEDGLRLPLPDLIVNADHIPAQLFLQKPFTIADLSRRFVRPYASPRLACPRCGREYDNVAPGDDGWSPTLMFSCASCHTDYFKIAESMYARGLPVSLVLGIDSPGRRWLRRTERPVLHWTPVRGVRRKWSI
jgi:hypothetical protein